MYKKRSFGLELLKMIANRFQDKSSTVQFGFATTTYVSNLKLLYDKLNKFLDNNGAQG